MLYIKYNIDWFAIYEILTDFVNDEFPQTEKALV